jgi:hypothetical protein
VSSCILALLIDCCSNIIAQRLKAYKNDVPFVFDHVLFSQFFIFGAIGGPVNFYWQGWLERAFPGWKTVKRSREATHLEMEKEGASLRLREEGAVDGGLKDKVEEVKVRDWWNVFRKWFTDCITMGALLNTTLFLVVMGVLKGKSWPVIASDLRTVSTFLNRTGPILTSCPGNVAHYMGLVQGVADSQFLQHHIFPR